MESHAPNEFHIRHFAQHYEAISDTFIDIRRVTASLESHLARGAHVFEIGLGTGYFASLLTAAGHTVEGIQPADEMLPLLKRQHPDIVIAGECKLEDYQFTQKFDTIVSHSSFFLVTRHETSFGPQGEVCVRYVLQSFAPTEDSVITCVHKILNALTSNGRLFINIQSNPLMFAAVEVGGERLTFEMTRCVYFMDLRRVEKTFRLTFRQHTHHVNDHRYCEPYLAFVERLATCGFRATITEDCRWVMVTRSGSGPQMVA